MDGRRFGFCGPSIQFDEGGIGGGGCRELEEVTPFHRRIMQAIGVRAMESGMRQGFIMDCLGGLGGREE